MVSRYTVMAIAIVAAGGVGRAQETRVEKEDLPPAVLAAAAAQTKRDTVKGYSKEGEKGKTFYEAETLRNGHSRDLLFDAAGAVVEIEEAVDPGAAPEPVRAALAARGGQVLRLESVTKGTAVTYEALVRKNGKRSEVMLDADGKEVK